MEEMLKNEETNVVEDTQVYDLEPVESNNSGSGLAGKLVVGGILALAGAAGALVWKMKKAKDDKTLTKADRKAIERLEKKGFTVCEQVVEEEATEESEPETEESEEQESEKEKK